METAQTAETNDVISGTVFRESAAYLLRETFEGPQAGMAAAFLDRAAGFLRTVEDVTAAQASLEFQGTTIAAQTEHAKFYLDRLCEFLDGRTERVNWEDSWLIETVDEAEWEALRNSLHVSYGQAIGHIAVQREANERNVGMVFGMIAHTAYHLGAIRQIFKYVTSK